MASLTPGVLSKLLQNVGNSDVKVAGEHRTALLQVIGIVPSLVGADDGDPWRSKGYFLRVSDSMHSAYVSISDEDVDLILSDKIQLGQFIYVARLDSASPVPVLHGVKPVPRRRPCIGEPKDLISSDSLSVRTKVDFSAASKRVSKGAGLKRAEANATAKAKRSVGEEPRTRSQSVENGKVEGLELRRLSLDSTRKGWDRSMAVKSSPRPLLRPKSKETSSSSDAASLCSIPQDVHFTTKAYSDKDSATRRPNLTISPLKSKNENVTQKLVAKPLEKNLKSSPDGILPSHLIKVPLNFKTLSAQDLTWDSLPNTIHDLGKEAMGHRDLAFLAAVSSLEEASAAESVIRCMSMFVELCQSSQKESTGALVEQFLNLHQSMQKAAAVVDAIIDTRLQEPKTRPTLPPPPLPEICETFPNKNAVSWVLAAVETDLSKFCLFKKEDKMGNLNDKKSHLVILENAPKKVESENYSPQCKRSPINHGRSLSVSRANGPSPSRKPQMVAKRTENVTKVWSKGSGLNDAASLAGKLLLESREWFLNYLDNSLNKGFGLRTEEPGSEIASLLRQLKRVNQWLDDSNVGGARTDEKTENVRKKLYGFLLENV